MRNPSKFLKSYVNKFKTFELTPLEKEKFIELVRILSNSESYKLKSSPVSEEIAEKRFKICQGCEHITKDLEKYGDSDSHCDLCNCNLKNKVQRPYEQCPLRKWVNDDKIIKDHVNQAEQIINDLVNDETWIQLLSSEEQFEVNYQEAIERLEKDSSTDLVDELIKQSESTETNE
jgi:hypothetical protein